MKESHSRTPPVVSVIIPTYNRCASLKRTLDALCVQTYSLQQIEVLVVADGCTDGTVEMLHHYEASFVLHIVKQPSQGAAAARNQGAAQASGRLLLFLDDDVEPTSSLIEAHIRTHQRQPRQVVIGPYPPKEQRIFCGSNCKLGGRISSKLWANLGTALTIETYLAVIFLSMRVCSLN